MTIPTWAGLAGDHHVHSTFSDDAESTVAENVAAARQAGLNQAWRAAATFSATVLSASSENVECT